MNRIHSRRLLVVGFGLAFLFILIMHNIRFQGHWWIEESYLMFFEFGFGLAFALLIDFIFRKILSIRIAGTVATIAASLFMLAWSTMAYFVHLPTYPNLEVGNRRGAKILIKQLMPALEDYKHGCGTYPTTQEWGNRALIEKPIGSKCQNYDPGGYIAGKRMPKDPWDREFNYNSSDGKSFVLKSLGADGKVGGKGEDADVSSDEPGF